MVVVLVTILTLLTNLAIAVFIGIALCGMQSLLGRVCLLSRAPRSRGTTRTEQGAGGELELAPRATTTEDGEATSTATGGNYCGKRTSTRECSIGSAGSISLVDVELAEDDDISLPPVKAGRSSHSGISCVDQGLADAPTSLRLIEMAFESHESPSLGTTHQKHAADEG